MRCDEVVMWLTTHFHFSHFFLKTNWSTINSIHTDLIWSLIWSASPDPDRFVHWFWSDPFQNVWSWSVLENLKSFMIGFGKFEIEMIALGKNRSSTKIRSAQCKIFAARTCANKNKMKENPHASPRILLGIRPWPIENSGQIPTCFLCLSHNISEQYTQTNTKNNSK